MCQAAPPLSEDHLGSCQPRITHSMSQAAPPLPDLSPVVDNIIDVLQ